MLCCDMLCSACPSSLPFLPFLSFFLPSSSSPILLPAGVLSCLSVPVPVPCAMFFSPYAACPALSSPALSCPAMPCPAPQPPASSSPAFPTTASPLRALLRPARLSPRRPLHLRSGLRLAGQPRAWGKHRVDVGGKEVLRWSSRTSAAEHVVQKGCRVGPRLAIPRTGRSASCVGTGIKFGDVRCTYPGPNEGSPGLLLI